MGTFKTSRLLSYTTPRLAPVAEQVMLTFREQGYEVTGRESVTGGWLISLTKGNVFKAVLGLKTALNIELEPTTGGTHVEAGIGIFGRQVVPAAIGLLIFWPVLVTQVAGVVRNARLDDEAMRVVEEALKAHAEGTVTGGAAAQFCTACGRALPAHARFCLECGAGVASAV